MVEEEFKLQDDAAPFNMALATLEAIRSILSDIKRVNADPFMNDELKQKLKIGLVKSLYRDSAPLLDEKIVKQFQPILRLKPMEKDIINNENGVSIKTHKKKLIYSEELEFELDINIVNIQMELKKERYYMPPKKDKGSAVGDF